MTVAIMQPYFFPYIGYFHPSRNHIRSALFQEQIYPSVHWPIDRVVPVEFSESHQLANEVMTLTCDQRYSSEDMHRVANLVFKTLNIEHGKLQ